MKILRLTQQLGMAALTGVVLAFGPDRAQADTNYLFRFDTATEVDAWTFDFGGPSFTNSFDPTQDGNTNASSGAMKVVLGFSTNYIAGGSNRYAFIAPLSAPISDTNLSDLDSIHFDLKVDSGSATDVFGLNGYMALVFRANGGWDWRQQWGDNIGVNYPSTDPDPTKNVDSNGWRHIDAPITLTVNDTNVHHIDFQLWGNDSQDIDGPVTLWIDNIYYTTVSSTTSAPPMLNLARTLPGLSITASVNGTDDMARYQRQDIRTSSANYLWINPSNGPVTYSFTIANFPIGPTNGFEARLMLVGNNVPGGPFADYNEANVIYYRLIDYGSNSPLYAVELRYKVGLPNSSIFASGSLATVTNLPSALGTWGLTLAGTNFTAFGPGFSTNGSFGADVLTAFNTNTYLYIGIVPNRLEHIGQSVIFSGASITGAVTTLNDQFVNLNKWYKGVAQDPTGVLIQPANTFAKILWSPPQSPAYSLHTNNTLAAIPSWPAAGLTVNTVGTNKVVLLPTPTTNGPKFFRLESP